MIVDGEIINGSCSEFQKAQEMLRLKFVFQVNWRLTQYYFQTNVDDRWIWLQDWNAWNSVCDLLFSMGYKFEDSMFPTYGIIRKWIEAIKLNTLPETNEIK